MGRNEARPGREVTNSAALLQHGQVLATHSVAAGLDYPAVGPEHSYLRELGRVEYTSATDEEALDAFNVLCRSEGIIPALESAHAVAEALKRAGQMQDDQIMIVNLSGRGDKDLGRSDTGVASDAEAGQ